MKPRLSFRDREIAQSLTLGYPNLSSDGTSYQAFARLHTRSAAESPGPCSRVSGSRIAKQEYSSRDWLSRGQTSRLVISVTMIDDPKIHSLASTDIVILEE